jgi:hypothetical protein
MSHSNRHEPNLYDPPAVGIAIMVQYVRFINHNVFLLRQLQSCDEQLLKPGRYYFCVRERRVSDSTKKAHLQLNEILHDRGVYIFI